MIRVVAGAGARAAREHAPWAVAMLVFYASVAQAQSLGAVAHMPASGPNTAPVEASSRVSRRELEERLPRSAPDALRYEPGVSVQQTAHAQASPYVRGMTGQQVVHLFDGVRLNNGIYRQGPNQYFFTVDVLSLDHLMVERGAASVRYGSDALGGAILAVPRAGEPSPSSSATGLWAAPRAYFRYASQDTLLAGRAESSIGYGSKLRILLGGGYRDADRLTSGGVVQNSNTPRPPWVPRFESDGKTMLGTGFRDATFDGRVEYDLRPKLTAVGAVYGYRQFDAPRTDQCPPREAPEDDCLVLEHEFRTLAYVALRGDVSKAVEDLDLRLSGQGYDERARRSRPTSYVEQTWENDVRTTGLAVSAHTHPFSLGDAWDLTLAYGADGYADRVHSSAQQRLTDLGRTFDLSRGSYLEGSRYLTSGAFASLQSSLDARLELRTGVRAAHVRADAPADPESGTSAVSEHYSALVGQAGATVHLTDLHSLSLNYDQGFRAPNLDDLTARQQVGPGFQFENARLKPERAHTFELGLASRLSWFSLDAWAFATFLDGAIARTLREATDCPPETPACAGSRTHYQLVNARSMSRILGAEGGATFFLPLGVTARSVVSYAWGDGPRNPSGNSAEKGPLSRIPPLQGNLEVRYRHLASATYAAWVMRWAHRQDRLSLTDASDARIPQGGTPGYVVVDLRAGLHVSQYILLSASFDNLFDAAYRVHGSSINGPGRGASVGLRVSY